MPIYEYVCRNCGHALEQLQRLSDDALTLCPACGDHALKRKMSAAGFRLAGGGWYETDFKSDRRRNVAGAEEPGSAAAKGDNGGDDKKSGDDKQKSAGDAPAKDKSESGPQKPPADGGGPAKTAPKKDSGASKSPPSK